MKKRKLALSNIKKKAERLRKNPKPMAKKVEMMLKYKGLWGPPKTIRLKANKCLMRRLKRLVEVKWYIQVDTFEGWKRTISI